VFVSQLQIRADEDDVKAFFESVCKVVSVALIRDKSSHKSKGFGYVELDSLEDVAKALMLSGLPFIWRDGTQGFPILVKSTETDRKDKPRPDHRGGGAGGGDREGRFDSKAPRPAPPKAELVERVGEGACKVKIDGREAIALVPMLKGKPMLTRTLALQGLPADLTRDDVHALFESFGPMLWLDLQPDQGGKNSAIVQFVDMDVAARANNQLNGSDVLDSRLSCIPVADSQRPSHYGLATASRHGRGGAGGDNEGWALDDDDETDKNNNSNNNNHHHHHGGGGGGGARRSGRGMALAADRRVELMSKLAGGAAQEFLPQVAAMAAMSAAMPSAATQQPPPPPQPQPPQPQPQPPPHPAAQQRGAQASRFVLVSNMFNPAEETEEGWAKDIEDDMRDESANFGAVADVRVDTRSPEGRVLVAFEAPEAAQKALQALNGRWFAKRQLKCQFVAAPPF